MTTHDPEAVRTALARAVTQARTYRDPTERTRAIARAYVTAADHLTAGRQAVRDADAAALTAARRKVLMPRRDLVSSPAERQAASERLDRYVSTLREMDDPDAIRRRLEDADRTGNELLVLAVATVALERTDGDLAVAASQILDPTDRNTEAWDLVWTAAVRGGPDDAMALAAEALEDHLDLPEELAGLSIEAVRSIARQTDTTPPPADTTLSDAIGGVAGVTPASSTKALNDPALVEYARRWPDMVTP